MALKCYFVYNQRANNSKVKTESQICLTPNYVIVAQKYAYI